MVQTSNATCGKTNASRVCGGVITCQIDTNQHMLRKLPMRIAAATMPAAWVAAKSLPKSTRANTDGANIICALWQGLCQPGVWRRGRLPKQHESKYALQAENAICNKTAPAVRAAAKSLATSIRITNVLRTHKNTVRQGQCQPHARRRGRLPNLYKSNYAVQT